MKPRIFESTSRILFTFFCVLICGGLFALGVWQLKRLEWKENLIKTMEYNSRQSPVVFPFNFEPKENPEFRKVVLSGYYLHSQEIYIGAKYFGKKLGYYLFTPFMLEDQTIVIINRGWVPNNKDKQEPGEVFRSNNLTLINGIIRKTDHKQWVFPENIPEEGKWFWVDLAGIAKYFRSINNDSVVRPILIQATDEKNEKEYPKILPSEFHLQNDHLQYAITWFSLMIAMIIMYLIYMRKEVNRQE